MYIFDLYVSWNLCEVDIELQVENTSLIWGYESLYFQNMYILKTDKEGQLALWIPS